jgi:hypothetical protein
MSLDIHVYASNLSDDLIPQIIKRLNDHDMVVEVHPDFSFTDQTGFLPFRFQLINPPFNISKDKKLSSGFELYLDDFDLQTEKKALNTEPSFFNRLLKKKKEEELFAPPEIEDRLKNCKKVATFNWHASDTFETRFALLTSAILTELTNGVCYNPQEDVWYGNKDIVENAYKEVLEVEQLFNAENVVYHEFTRW